MPKRPSTAEPRQNPLLALDELRAFAGERSEFWPKLLAAATSLTGATGAALLLPAADGNWTVAFASPAWPPLDPEALAHSAKTAQKSGEVLAFSRPQGTNADCLLAVRADDPGAQTAVLALSLAQVSKDRALDALARLKLLAGITTAYQLRLAAQQSRSETERFASTLEANAALQADERFTAAAMRLCNLAATRFHADRVSLGWLRGDYVALQAISHAEKFDRKMNPARALEAAMEEALDQDEEIVFPASAGTRAVTRDHEQFATREAAGNVVSLPLRVRRTPLAVLSLERKLAAFTAQELTELRVLCDQIAPRLEQLWRQDRWFGARWAAAAKPRLKRLLGPEHTGRKLIALSVSLALAVLCFVKIEYRVDAPFTLKSDTVAHLPAPFDGYLREIHFRVGDEVQADQPLVTLDTRELLLREASAVAEWNRYRGETEKAQSLDNVAEMRIAEALTAQAKARLDLARHQIQQAVLKAPFRSVVVEPDLRERTGAPVKQGDLLCKVAQLDTLRVELEVSEQSIHELRPGARGELAFATRPELHFPITVERIEPVAETDDRGTYFRVRARLESAAEPWWRPGMTGTGKLEAGPRTLLWILTHRTVERLRIWAWW